MLSASEAPSSQPQNETDSSPLRRLRMTVGTFLQQLDRIATVLVVAAVALDGAIWLYVGLRQRFLPDVLPIHYNTAGQVDRVGVREQLFILPVIGVTILVLNGALAYVVNSREPALSYVILSVSVAVQLLLAGAAIQLIH